jgi:hypothetical protein
MADPITDYYSLDPWGDLTEDNHEVYQTVLRDRFVKENIYNKFVNYRIDLGAAKTRRMYWDQIIGAEVNWNTVATNALWLPSGRIDSRRMHIDLENYANAMKFHRYDEWFMQWTENGGGLEPIARGELGNMLLEHLDILAMEAFLDWPSDYVSYAGSASTIGTLTTADKFTDPEHLEDLWLMLEEREVPMAQSIDGSSRGSLVCLTTPHVISGMRQASDTLWYDVAKVQDKNMLINKNEVGSLNNCRFVKTMRNLIRNFGTVEAQTTVTAATAAHDGAAATVEGIWTVGQTGHSGVLPYITVASSAGFTVGDYVTIHSLRSSAYGVTNGLNPKDGTAVVRKIVAKPTAQRLAFDKPLMKDFTTLLTDSTYAYVTKGLDVHMSVFLAGPNPVACAVGKPPVFHNPPPIDDLEAQVRFSYEMMLKFQCWEPRYAQVMFSAAREPSFS